MTLRGSISSALFVLLAAAGAAQAQIPQQDAWRVLETGTASTNTSQRAVAVRVLGLIPGDAQAIEKAESALQDKEEDVRAAGAAALGKMGSKNSAAKLHELLKDPEVSVVMAAAQALKSLGDPRAYEVYYAILTGERKTGEGLMDQQKKMLHDPKKMAQYGIEAGIGFVPFGGVALGAFKMARKDDISPVRAGAAGALSSDPDPRSGQALVAAASDKSEIVRAAALDSIAVRNDSSLIPAIVPMMKDEKDVVRYTAAAAVIRLSNIGGPTAAVTGFRP